MGIRFLNCLLANQIKSNDDDSRHIDETATSPDAMYRVNENAILMASNIESQYSLLSVGYEYIESETNKIE